MKRMLQQGVLLLMGTLLWGCEQEIPFRDSEIPGSKLTLMGEIQADASSDTTLFFISNSRFSFSADPMQYLPDAVLRLYVNGELRSEQPHGEVFRIDTLYQYDGTTQVRRVYTYPVVGRYAPQDQVRVEVSHPRYRTIVAQGGIPKEPEILKATVDTSRVYTNSKGEVMGFRTEITLRNAPGAELYYRIKLLRLTRWDNDYPKYPEPMRTRFDADHVDEA
jgi:hypothetical protein